MNHIYSPSLSRQTSEDSFNEFRSDFVHASLSLRSGMRKVTGKQESERGYSSLHLTPQLFTHFWSWCQLFDGALSLPIRQGNYYPARPITPKLGRHMATIKYRLSIPHLYVMHGYIDDSRESTFVLMASSARSDCCALQLGSMV